MVCLLQHVMAADPQGGSIAVSGDRRAGAGSASHFVAMSVLDTRCTVVSVMPRERHIVTGKLAVSRVREELSR
jgi:hypothetical protein